MFDTPQTLFKKYSAISQAEIIVLERGKQRSLNVSHFNYSLWSSDPDDLFEDRYWGKTIKKIKDQRSKIKNALVMGLAGGTLAYLLDHYFSPEKIDGIEIDPVVIEASRKFLYLEQLPNLNLIQADAVSWLGKQMEAGRKDLYDVIILDLFQLDTTPFSCDTLDFYQKTAQLLKPSGILTLNKIYSTSIWDQEVAQFLQVKIAPFFRKWEVIRERRPLNLDNALYFAWNKKT